MDEKGFPPTVSELAEVLSKTKASVHANLESLVDKGFIRRTVGKARSIEIVPAASSDRDRSSGDSILGDVPAGIPVIVENTHAAKSGGSISSGERIMLCAKGIRRQHDECRHLDGDVVVVRKQQLAVSGEIVVACIDGEVTVKRLDVTRDAIRLTPENPNFNRSLSSHIQDLKILESYWLLEE